jgi:type I restriction enzyme M protein
MVGLLNPRVGDVICDPASGTGGFLIRCFEYVRDAILQDVQGMKQNLRLRLEQQAADKGWDEDELAKRLEQGFSELNRQLDLQDPDSRLYRLGHAGIHGVDAEARAARTSKMNMIMHGDGHGGIHYHDGLLDVNGIFAGRFKIVVTNPPFGAKVRDDQRVGATEQTRVEDDPRLDGEYPDRYGEGWKTSHARMLVAAREKWPILRLFDIGREPVGGELGTSKVRKSLRTETLFLERCITLLAPGGRMGIVLPDGILSNSSMQWLRDYVEGRARLLAVVSLPHEVFASTGATVKTSLVFLQRFTADEKAAWERANAEARKEVGRWQAEQLADIESHYLGRIATALGDDIAAKYENAGPYGPHADLADVRSRRRRVVSRLGEESQRAILEQLEAEVWQRVKDLEG